MIKSSFSFRKRCSTTSLRALMLFSFLIACVTTAPTFSDIILASQPLNPLTTGFKPTGPAASSFGFIVSQAGDINKDGFADFIVGANAASKAYVIYGGPKSSMSSIDLNTLSLIPGTTGFTITGPGSSSFGWSVSGAGDVNKDGYDDIIVGAPDADKVWVIYGRDKSLTSDINLVSQPLASSSKGFMITGSTLGQLGYSVGRAGDINGDGYADIIMSAPSAKKVYVIYGRDQSLLSDFNLVSQPLASATTGFTITGPAVNGFGYSVGTAGDFNKDEYDDIILSSINENKAYVIYGRDKTLLSDISLAIPTLDPLTTGFIITGLASSNFGVSVDTAGDIDKDGYDDIIVGAFSLSKAYVIYGRDKSLMSDINLSTNLNPLTTGFTVTGSGHMGYSVSTAGDINKDGYADIIIGDNAGFKAYVIYGKDRSLMADLNVVTQPLAPLTTGFTITGGGGNFGYAVSSAGDLNRDGYDDIIVGANQDNGLRGAAYVIYSCSSCPTCPLNCDECTGPSACTKCKSPYLFYNSGCVASCPATTFQAADKCEDCSTDCEHCSSATVCTECTTPKLLYNSGCLGSCPDTTFASLGKCEPCSSGCYTCSGSDSTCTGCNSPKLLYSSGCVGSCPDTTFASLGKCEPCSSSCYTCSGSASTCTGCISSEFLYQSLCFGTCPPTTFPSLGKCEDCSPNCDQCSSASVCTLCTSPNLLYNSGCVGSCPAGTFPSANSCQYCAPQCSSCASQTSCQSCNQGYTMSNSICILSPPSSVSPASISAQEKATQAVASGAKGIGSVVCVGSAAVPLTALVSKTVQNTRYLNLSVTNQLSEIYQTWSTDMIPWAVPNVLSSKDNFKTSPYLFSRYDVDSPFLVNFWPTLLNVIIGFGTFIICILLQKLFEQVKHEGWASKLVQRLVAGSFNFALIQTYACLDDVVFYLVLDVRTNPFKGFFSWASLISASIFLVVGCGLVFFNFWTVTKYQQAKKQGVKEVEAFNEKNKYWELFYSDFNDDDLWSQSFFAILIMRSSLSSLLITVAYDYPMMQICYLIAMDGAIIMFLYFKNPFNTLRGKLAQYYYEIITLLVHLCTFIIGLQDTFEKSSETVRIIFSTSIIYLNTALVTGSIGFVFIEIYKSISERNRAPKCKCKEHQKIPEDKQETQNLTQTASPLQPFESDAYKTQDWINREKRSSSENYYILPKVHHRNGNITDYDLNMESQESNFNADNSIVSEIRMNPQMKMPIIIQQKPLTINQRRQKSRARNLNQAINTRQFE